MTSLSKSKIYFYFKAPATLGQRTRLKAFIENIFRKEKRKLQSLNYIFCTDKELLAINRKYLKHDYYTDIISFESSGKNEALVGDIYISIDRVKENALTYGAPLFKEVHRVMFHGVLHFCGYQDKTKTQANKMRAMEEKYLSQYFKQAVLLK